MEVGQELVARSPSGRRRYSRRSASPTTEILEAAAAEFLERGFNEAKLEAVAQRAGIARSLIYRYFATKEDVFRAVVIDTLAPHVQSLKDRTETAPGGLAPLLCQTAFKRDPRSASKRDPLFGYDAGLLKMALRCVRRRAGVARPEARAAQDRFLKAPKVAVSCGF